MMLLKMITIIESHHVCAKVNQTPPKHDLKLSTPQATAHGCVRGASSTQRHSAPNLGLWRINYHRRECFFLRRYFLLPKYVPLMQPSCANLSAMHYVTCFVTKKCGQMAVGLYFFLLRKWRWGVAAYVIVSYGPDSRAVLLLGSQIGLLLET
jgi:hypothetical protein